MVELIGNICFGDYDRLNSFFEWHSGSNSKSCVIQCIHIL